MRQTIMILVGPDRTGKSNIGRALAGRADYSYYKASSERDAFVNDQSKFINDIRYADPRIVDFIKQTKVNVIMDRGFPCEWVYSRFFSRPTDENAIEMIDRAYAELDAFVILCVRKNGYEGIFDDLDPTRLDPTALSKIDSLYREYVSKHMNCRHMILEVDDENVEAQIQRIYAVWGS